jgi:uncharacterized protein YjbJ (UPF0337 family)
VKEQFSKLTGNPVTEEKGLEEQAEGNFERTLARSRMPSSLSIRPNITN